MRTGSLTRYALGLAAALAAAAVWPHAGLHHPSGPGLDGPAPDAPATSAIGAPAVELEIGDPGGDDPIGPAGTAPSPASRYHGGRARGAPDLSVSLALQGFLARPPRAPPALSG